MFKDDDDDGEASMGAVRYPVMPSLVALQQMRNRLHLAQLGKKLMKWTAMATLKELRRIANEIQVLIRDYEVKCRSAFICLARARYFVPGMNDSVLESVPNRATITVKRNVKSVSGVKTQYFSMIQEPGADAYVFLGMSKGGIQIQKCKEAWLDLVRQMILICQYRVTFVMVDAANKNATKVYNKLSKEIIPQLISTIQDMSTQLEKQDRAGILIKTMKNKNKLQKAIDKLLKRIVLKLISEYNEKPRKKRESVPTYYKDLTKNTFNYNNSNILHITNTTLLQKDESVAYHLQQLVAMQLQSLNDKTRPAKMLGKIDPIAELSPATFKQKIVEEGNMKHDLGMDIIPTNKTEALFPNSIQNQKLIVMDLQSAQENPPPYENTPPRKQVSFPDTPAESKEEQKSIKPTPKTSRLHLTTSKINQILKQSQQTHSRNAISISKSNSSCKLSKQNSENRSKEDHAPLESESKTQYVRLTSSKIQQILRIHELSQTRCQIGISQSQPNILVEKSSSRSHKLLERQQSKEIRQTKSNANLKTTQMTTLDSPKIVLDKKSSLDSNAHELIVIKPSEELDYYDEFIPPVANTNFGKISNIVEIAQLDDEPPTLMDKKSPVKLELVNGEAFETGEWFESAEKILVIDPKIEVIPEITTILSKKTSATAYVFNSKRNLLTKEDSEKHVQLSENHTRVTEFFENVDIQRFESSQGRILSAAFLMDKDTVQYLDAFQSADEFDEIMKDPLPVSNECLDKNKNRKMINIVAESDSSEYVYLDEQGELSNHDTSKSY